MELEVITKMSFVERTLMIQKYNISGSSDWGKDGFSAYPDSCAGRCAEFVVNIFAVSFLYFLSAGGGRKTLFRRASVFCAINLILRGVGRW